MIDTLKGVNFFQNWLIGRAIRDNDDNNDLLSSNAYEESFLYIVMYR